MSRQNDDLFALQRSREHEKHTNRLVGLVSLGLVLNTVIIQMMLYFDYSSNVSYANKYIFLPIGVILVVFYLIARHHDFDAPWIKYMLTGGVVLMTTGQFFIFTVFASYSVLLPLVISIRYFNKKFIAEIAAISAILFTLACVLNVQMADKWTVLREAHDSNVYDPWTRAIDALVFVIIPLGMTAIFTAAYGIETTGSGRRLMNIQAQAASRIAAVDTELNMAADIQRSALPSSSFLVPGGGFAVEAMETPAKEVGGDFYDYFMLNDSTLAVLIADISDKGVPAALFMMSAQKAIRCATECCHNLEDSIHLANRLICSNNESNMFLTLWIGVIDTNTGIGKYANAGHPFPLIRTAAGDVIPLSNEPDAILGVFPDQPPAVHTFTLTPGDTLLLYTDGITDSMTSNGDFFGTEGVESVLQRCGEDCAQTVKEVMDSSIAFARGQEQFDDMTILALKCISTKPLKQFCFEGTACADSTNRILDGVNALLEGLSCPDDVRRNTEVVVDELCANISDYAYDGESGPLRLYAEAGSNFIRLRFEDEGAEFNPLLHTDPIFTDEPTSGGLGLYFVKNLADRVSFCRSDNLNQLTVEMVWGM